MSVVVQMMSEDQIVREFAVVDSYIHYDEELLSGCSHLAGMLQHSIVVVAAVDQ